MARIVVVERSTYGANHLGGRPSATAKISVTVSATRGPEVVDECAPQVGRVTRPDVGGEDTVLLRGVERIGVVDIVLADVERLEQVGRCVATDAVQQRLGAAGRVAPVDGRVGRRAALLDLGRQGEEPIARVDHRLDVGLRQPVAGDLEEAELPCREIDRPTDGQAIGIAAPPSLQVDDRDLRHVSLTRTLRNPRRS
jgi:hypothetical protein